MTKKERQLLKISSRSLINFHEIEQLESYKNIQQGLLAEHFQ